MRRKQHESRFIDDDIPTLAAAMSPPTPVDLQALRLRMKYTNCGCRYVDFGNPQYGQGDVHWVYCPLHAQAPALVEALKEAQGFIDLEPGRRKIHDRISGLLDAVYGPDRNAARS